jgi:hypothetical protein
VAAPGVGHPSSFSPFIAIFRDVIMRVVARMVARVARVEEGEATSSWELTAPSFTFHRLP